ncbi:hypothetical protein ODI_R1182 [Orrella dioscoreae]|uniref:Uncharacterized protein n=2 Tax=Orrella dioscoreae TaxID=1851544 RepID=A0A1C3JYU1_9BURK|nr:hypothetical protein ODI_02488 [Orrella dioscoreae]SOE48016.1 hypothetical protein ODI_R1182 [Orrella dioscoreae]
MHAMEWETIDVERLASLGVFNEALGVVPNIDPTQAWPGEAPIRILLHRGDLALDGLAFDTNRFLSLDADMLIVDGNLILQGDLDVEQFDVGTPGYLVVKGDLKAGSLFLTGQFECLVRGDLSAAAVVLGTEASSGRLRVGGTVQAPVTVMVDFPIKAGALDGTFFVQNRRPYEDLVIAIGDASATRRIRVEEDEEFGQYWLLRLPEGTSQAELDTEAFPECCILTEAAQADHEGTGGGLSLKEVLRKHGAQGFKAA